MERSSTKSTSESAHRNSFAEYALFKSTGFPSSASNNHHHHLRCHPDDDLLDIVDEPSPTSPTTFAPPQSIPVNRHNRHTRRPSTGLSPIGSPQSTSAYFSELSCHPDLVAAARREHDSCGTAEEKREFKSRWVPILLNRLRDLSEMEAKSTVGVEIADTVDFLKTLYPSESVCKEIGEISDKSRQGVIKLQEGLLLVDKAKEQLRSALHKKLFSVE
ncbi:hypothetical protein LINPERHAP1_LOCUS37357 [Linum perenne]